MKVKIGIIGLGDIAQKVYLPLLAADERIEIAGLASRNPETVARIASQYRIEKQCGSAAELLALAPDAVFVHSPTETHAELVTECLKAGVHVYVDKPLSYKLEESEKMAELALERGKLLAVGFNRRFAPRYVQAKQWLEQAGGFDLCVVQKHRTRQQRHSAKLTLYDDLIHMLDLLVWLGGPDLQVDAYRQRTSEDDRLLAASGSVVFSHAGADGKCESRTEAAGQFSMVRLAGQDMEKLELHGFGRSAEVTNMEEAVLYDKTGGERRVSFGSWDGILLRRGFAGVVDHFIRTLHDRNACTIRADLVLETHRLVEKLARSVQ